MPYDPSLNSPGPSSRTPSGAIIDRFGPSGGMPSRSPTWQQSSPPPQTPQGNPWQNPFGRSSPSWGGNNGVFKMPGPQNAGQLSCTLNIPEAASATVALFNVRTTFYILFATRNK